MFKNEATIVQIPNDHSSESEHQPKYNHNIIQNPTQRKKPDWMDGLEDGDECFEKFLVERSISHVVGGIYQPRSEIYINRGRWYISLGVGDLILLGAED